MSFLKPRDIHRIRKAEGNYLMALDKLDRKLIGEMLEGQGLADQLDKIIEMNPGILRQIRNISKMAGSFDKLGHNVAEIEKKRIFQAAINRFKANGAMKN